MGYIRSFWRSLDKKVIIEKKYHSHRMMPSNPTTRERRAPRTGEETPERQKEINRKRKAEKLKMELLDNFPRGSLYLTCTYSEKPEVEKVPGDFAAFKRRLARLYKKLGVEFKYIAVLENLKGHGRPHIHILLPELSSADSRLLEECWGMGNVRIEMYKGAVADATRLSDYFCKEKVAEHSGRIRKSHNLIRREPRKKTITERDTYSDNIQAPAGYHVVKEYSYQGRTVDGYPLLVAVYEKDSDNRQKRGRKKGKPARE